MVFALLGRYAALIDVSCYQSTLRNVPEERKPLGENVMRGSIDFSLWLIIRETKEEVAVICN
jgi:hypothetical protein